MYFKCAAAKDMVNLQSKMHKQQMNEKRCTTPPLSLKPDIKTVKMKQ